jgi:hypothetical protein
MPATESSGMRHRVTNENRKTPGNAGEERRETPIFVSLYVTLKLPECTCTVDEFYLPRSYIRGVYIGGKKGCLIG